MKRITVGLFAIVQSMHALTGGPSTVPDSASGAGLIVISLLVLAALRRKFTK